MTNSASLSSRRKALRTISAAAATSAVLAPAALAAGVEPDIWAARYKLSKDYTLKIAEAMPAEKDGYKPTGETSGDGARSFGEVMQHIASAEGFYIGRFGKSKAPAGPKDAAGKADVSKAATISYLTATFDWVIGIVSELTPADLTNAVPAGRPSGTGLDMLLDATIHTAHTRGYADMYLRNNGIKPPSYNVG
jgi:uncharacterized damage-inducible protein DinB